MRNSMKAEQQQRQGEIQRSLFETADYLRPYTNGDGGTGSVRSEERQALTAWTEMRALTVNLTVKVCERHNLNLAYKRVKANKGSPGTDGMSVKELREWLKTHGGQLVKSLGDGSYQPDPVRGVEIPKPGGGMRKLGIPTVRDRLVQQAILQVLEPVLDPTFSSSSYGFRAKRSAHDALKQASRYVAEGRSVVVDCDLEKFFDKVHHDILMARLARRIADKHLLKIIRRFLEAGMMKNGVVMERYQGTPQGGPLSPPVGESAVGRPRQGAGTTRSPVLPLRRRLCAKKSKPLRAETCCAKDEGRPLEIALQDEVSNHPKAAGVKSPGSERLGKRQEQPVR